MSKECRIINTCLLIQPPAELDHHSAERIRVQADKLIEMQTVHTIIFDFVNTSFMDSSGIGVIMGRYKNISFIGGKVVAIRVSDRVNKILKMAGLYKIIEIHQDIPAEIAPVLIKGGSV